jgi:hypothetical protein
VETGQSQAKARAALVPMVAILMRDGVGRVIVDRLYQISVIESKDIDQFADEIKTMTGEPVKMMSHLEALQAHQFVVFDEISSSYRLTAQGRRAYELFADPQRWADGIKPVRSAADAQASA